MPELPEVETVRRGIAPYVESNTISHLIIRNSKLRWPIPKSLPQYTRKQCVHKLTRRGKYLLFEFASGSMILHLGMSGSLQVLTKQTEPRKHDHLDIVFTDGVLLRLTDPRRFGSVLWAQDWKTHKLLCKLGPEPLAQQCTGEYLYTKSQGRKVAVKNFIMNSHIIVGIGNIYACEALFQAGIHPQRKAGRISLTRYNLLIEAIRKVLNQAIAMGGTTLKDFVNANGELGYFTNQLQVYGHEGKECCLCNANLSKVVIGGRATVFCSSCQT